MPPRFAVRKYVAGCSVLALLTGCATAAFADCTGTNPTNCTGTTLGKVTVNSATTLHIMDGASLTGAGGDDAAIGVTSEAGSSATILIDGSVSGSRAGLIDNADNSYYYNTPTGLSLTVGATGHVSGISGIYLDATSLASGYRTVGATLDNKGLIEGSSYGLEANAASTDTSGFFSVTNEAGAIIRGSSGGIYGMATTVTNAGLIDGGYGPAYAYRFTPFMFTSVSTVNNTGTMRSNGYFDTIDFGSGLLTLNNQGTIENTYGRAIGAGNYLTLTNSAGGIISGGNLYNTAISALNGGTIVNQGTINGSVYLYGNPGSSSVLNNQAGAINGDVIFGSGDDTLNVSWDSSANRIAGISGTIDGGGGVNTLRADISQDTSLDTMLSHLVMPIHFQKLGVVIDDGVTATLNGDAPDGLLLGGNGDFVTHGQVTSAGAAFLQTLGPPYDYSSRLGFTNTGDIHATFAPPGGVVQYTDNAISLSSVRSFVNTGSISSTLGNGVSVSLGSIIGPTGGTFTNSGSITADGTAAYLALNGGTASNDGIIASTGGTGLSLNGLGGSFTNTGSITGVTGALFSGTGTVSNTGTITGTTAGVQISGASVSNSGAITATNGTGVDLYYGSGFDNLSGGVISGSTDAIESAYGGVTITNAGTINGDVNLGQSTYSSSSTFVDKGGSLNGNLVFGSGYDTYVTDISKLSDGKFSNISGTIDGGDGQDTVIFQVGSDATTKLVLPKNFENAEYDLSQGAKLTLSADHPLVTPLVLAGTGSVDLNADFDTPNAYGLFVRTAYGASYSDHGSLSIVSRGTMSFSQSGYYSGVGIWLQDTTEFENAGRISISSQYQVSPAAAAINGGDVVTNSGAITLDTAAAVSGALKVINTGSIIQAANAKTSVGLTGVNSVDNSGTIQVGGAAITLNYYSYTYPSTAPAPSIVNSGLIESTGMDAIDAYYSSSGALTINNTATGSIISDTAAAITSYNFYGNSLHNDGVIKGDINLLYGTNLIENHGSITGRVNMGYGDDILRLTGGSLTGSVDAGYGYDKLQLDVTDANAPVLALGTSSYANFEELDMMAGVASMGGAYSFNKIYVSGGRLIGLAGSSLSAPTIIVEPGATFGSAGKVVGDVTVAGTLSPGASPGTMTVVGNVTLAHGSTSLFELTPNVNDKLVVSGTLTIADGASLQMTGAPRLMPGQKLDLIEASGGVVGKFSTITGVPDTLYLTQSAEGLQGLELFSTAQTYPTQVSRIITQLNDALINGQVSDALISAFPALANPDSGDSSPTALLRLTPQAYASAGNLQVEDARAVFEALDLPSHVAGETPASFAFGQYIGSGGKTSGDAMSGIASAKINDGGVLSGVGYGSSSAWGAAFVAHLNGRQRIDDLAAHTKTQSLVLGLQGQLRVHGFRFGAIAAYDRADAVTSRLAPDDITVGGRYAMKSWMTNINASYHERLNANWAVEPRLAISSVQTTRNGLAEQGGSAFQLDVQKTTSRATFIDGQIKFVGGQTSGAVFHPFASVGFVTGTVKSGAKASALLTGLNMPVDADGLGLVGTRVSAGLGLRYDVTRHLRISAGYNGEFGNNLSHRATIAANWVF